MKGNYFSDMGYQFTVLFAVILLNFFYFYYTKQVSEFLAGALIGVMVTPSKGDTPR